MLPLTCTHSRMLPSTHMYINIHFSCQRSHVEKRCISRISHCLCDGCVSVCVRECFRWYSCLCVACLTMSLYRSILSLSINDEPQFHTRVGIVRTHAIDVSDDKNEKPATQRVLFFF